MGPQVLSGRGLGGAARLRREPTPCNRFALDRVQELREYQSDAYAAAYAEFIDGSGSSCSRA